MSVHEVRWGRADVDTDTSYVSIPKVCGHRAPVTDIKWNPFDDHVIASCSEDTTVILLVESLS